MLKSAVAAERADIKRAMTLARWNMGRAAKLLEVPVTSLRRTMESRHHALMKTYLRRNPGRGRPSDTYAQ